MALQRDRIAASVSSSSPATNRGGPFDKEYLDSLALLFASLTSDIQENRHKARYATLITLPPRISLLSHFLPLRTYVQVTLSKLLNRNLALFTSDLYYILPREFVNDLISRCVFENGGEWNAVSELGPPPSEHVRP